MPLEPIIAVAGIIVVWFAAIIAHSFLEEVVGLWAYFVYAAFIAAALYCLIRFIHWAWYTPMPFVS